MSWLVCPGKVALDVSYAMVQFATLERLRALFAVIFLASNEFHIPYCKRS